MLYGTSSVLKCKHDYITSARLLELLKIRSDNKPINYRTLKQSVYICMYVEQSIKQKTNRPNRSVYLHKPNKFY